MLFFFGLWFLLFALGLSGLLSSLWGMICIIGAAIVGQIFIATHAAIEASRLGAARLKWYNKWYVYICILLLTGVVIPPAILKAQHDILRVRTFKVPAESMSPSLKLGDCFLAKLQEYGDRLPQRGDIIVFPYPEDRSNTFVKRVVGLPGERLEIRDKIVFINGQRLQDPWAVHVSNVTYPSNLNPRDNLGPAEVPEGAVFVLGDNRDASYDSRFWGCVETKDIEGKAMFIYWSDDRGRIGKQLL
jgi:signal peptidase I